MAIRSEKLNRLVTSSECKASWDAMQGDGEHRFCAECQREVFDFVQMTPRDIRARIEASRGQLCARLTKRAGWLVVAHSAEPFASAWEQRRASPFAATIVTACLSLGAGPAQSTEPSAPAVAASPDGAGHAADPERPAKSHAALDGKAALRGRVIDEAGLALQGTEVVVRNALDGRQHATSTDADGTFALDHLPTGVYDLRVTLDGFEIDPQNDISLQAGENRRVDLTATTDRGSITLGGLMVSEEPLRRLFAESDLVVAARVGPSSVLDRSGEPADVATELQIESLLKGSVAGRKVAYRHAEDFAATLSESERQPSLLPGSRVLAFLKASPKSGARPGAPSFESADYSWGVRVLGEAELAAYVERLDALARLQRKAERRGEEDPVELMEWLVATAEDPYTRHEAAVEIREAVAALSEFAEKEGTTPMVAAADLQVLVDRFRGEGGTLSEEPRPAFLGAALTENQKKRLTRALRVTERLEESDLALFGAVRTWDEEAATAWLVRRLRTVKPKGDDTDPTWSLMSLAEELWDERMEGLVEAALEREDEITAQETGNGPEADQKLHQKELAALREELQHRLAEALASPQ